MKTASLLLIFMLATVLPSHAYDSGIAVVSENGSNMQVFVNGKLYNKQPGRFVRVRSTPGLFHIEIRVLNPKDKKWYTVRKDVRAQRGFEMLYKVTFANKTPELVEVKKNPVYSRYFLNPTLYNKHPVS